MDEGDISRELNKRLALLPATWEMRPLYRGPRKSRKPSDLRFELDKGDGALDPWRQLAILLGDGATLRRLRVCAIAECERLFYDASPAAARRTCSKTHKNRLGQRELRRKTHINKRAPRHRAST
jgi:predicted RNA-binding Zn ribbon-like protein